MRTLLPFFAPGDGPRTHRDMRDGDLLKAHAFGPRLLAAWQHGGAREWRDLALSFALAGVIPLLGRYFLAWPVWIMLVCMACDAWFIWFADCVKIALAEDAVRRQVDLANDGDVTYSVANVLRDGGRRGSGFVLGGARIARKLDNALATPRRWMLENLASCATLSALVGALCFLTTRTAASATIGWSLLLALAISALSRLLIGISVALRHRKPSDREFPQLLPDSMIGNEVIFLAVLALALQTMLLATPWAVSLAQAARWEVTRVQLGTLLFVDYALVASLLALIVRRRLRDRERLVRQFIAVSLDTQRARLQRLLTERHALFK